MRSNCFSAYEVRSGRLAHSELVALHAMPLLGSEGLSRHVMGFLGRVAEGRARRLLANLDAEEVLILCSLVDPLVAYT